ncbi:FAD-dependent monooxygenase [Nonomuraea turkmeniaca]|uniref:FAD-dependent monooxygenase n=1 Tax=Nonomuraea turkmeniaca TaxID=103838 RepID=UPI001B85FBD3|nr:FAD-dependent monooxygenase [Nonomuraea turkmeniaca]
MTVMVAGAGPAGLMVAGELALAGVDVTVVDRLPRCAGATRSSASSRTATGWT